MVSPKGMLTKVLLGVTLCSVPFLQCIAKVTRVPDVQLSIEINYAKSSDEIIELLN